MVTKVHRGAERMDMIQGYERYGQNGRNGPYAYCNHMVCYTWIAYQTAYLKAHYPDEYMSAYYELHKND